MSGIRQLVQIHVISGEGAAELCMHACMPHIEESCACCLLLLPAACSSGQGSSLLWQVVAQFAAVIQGGRGAAVIQGGRGAAVIQGGRGAAGRASAAWLQQGLPACSHSPTCSVHVEDVAACRLILHDPDGLQGAARGGRPCVLGCAGSCSMKLAQVKQLCM